MKAKGPSNTKCTAEQDPTCTALLSIQPTNNLISISMTSMERVAALTRIMIA